MLCETNFEWEEREKVRDGERERERGRLCRRKVLLLPTWNANAPVGGWEPILRAGLVCSSMSRSPYTHRIWITYSTTQCLQAIQITYWLFINANSAIYCIILSVSCVHSLFSCNLWFFFSKQWHHRLVTWQMLHSQCQKFHSYEVPIGKNICFCWTILTRRLLCHVSIVLSIVNIALFFNIFRSEFMWLRFDVFENKAAHTSVLPL